MPLLMFSTPSGPDTTRTVKTPESVTVGELEVEPSGQNLPTAQAVGAAALEGQKLPTGHTVGLAEDTPQKKPAGQARQAVLLVAPVLAL